MKRYRLPISLIRNLGRPVRRLRPTKMRIRYQSQGEETTLQERHEQAHANAGRKPELLPPAVDSMMLGSCFGYRIFHQMASDKARELAGPALLAAFFVAAALLVPPQGEFPINDDWDYFATVADLLHFGAIRLSDWP